MKKNYLSFLGQLILAVIGGVLVYEYQVIREENKSLQEQQKAIITVPKKEVPVKPPEVKEKELPPKVKPSVGPVAEKDSSVLEDANDFLNFIKDVVDVAGDVKDEL